MTEELKHISQYLIEFFNKNWNELSDYFKSIGNQDGVPFSKSEIIKMLQSDSYVVEWCFIEGLTWANEENYLDKLIVFAANDESYFVFDVNGKYIKYNKLNDTFKFVEKKQKTITIDVWE